MTAFCAVQNERFRPRLEEWEHHLSAPVRAVAHCRTETSLPGRCAAGSEKGRNHHGCECHVLDHRCRNRVGHSKYGCHVLGSWCRHYAGLRRYWCRVPDHKRRNSVSRSLLQELYRSQKVWVPHSRSLAHVSRRSQQMRVPHTRSRVGIVVDVVQSERSLWLRLRGAEHP